MIAMMIGFGFLPFSLSLSPKILSSGLFSLAVMAGMKRARLRCADPIFVIGVWVRPEVPL